MVNTQFVFVMKKVYLSSSLPKEHHFCHGHKRSLSSYGTICMTLKRNAVRT
jgi:hypothetical protein